MKKTILILTGLILASVVFASKTVTRRDSAYWTNGTDSVGIIVDQTNAEFTTDKPAFEFDKPIISEGDTLKPGLVNPVDSLVFNGLIPVVSEQDYTIFADTLTGRLAYYNEGGVRYFDAVDDVPFINTTGQTIYPSYPLSAQGIDVSTGRGLPSVAITNCLDIDLAYSFFGVSRDTVLNGQVGNLLIRNFLLDYNTTGFNVGDNIWVDCDTSLTNVRPMPPSYPIFVGRVLTSATDGIIAITASPFTGSDTDVNTEGMSNGIITQKQAIRDTIISNVLYFETYNEEYPTKDLPFMYSGDRYDLNTTTNTGTNGYARTTLTYGTSTEAQTNYIYIDYNAGSPQLAVSTTEFPDDGVRLAECGVFDQTTHETYGFGYFQRFNNSMNGSNTDGWVSKTAKRVRLEGSKYESGVDPTVTIVTDGAGLDSLQVSSTAGIIWQFNRQSFDSQDGRRYLWLNSPTGERFITDLNEIDSTETNIDLHGGNNRRYGLNIFAIQNSGGFEDYLAVTSPTDYYPTDNNAINDVNNYAVTSVPSKYAKVAVRLFRVVVNYSTTSSGTITNLLGAGGYQDERGQPLGIGGGGSGSGAAQTNFSDSDFSVYDNLDPTKILQFDASNITTGTTRTLTIPDVTDTIATRSYIQSCVLKDFATVEFNDSPTTDKTWSLTSSLVRQNIYEIDSYNMTVDGDTILIGTTQEYDIDLNINFTSCSSSDRVHNIVVRKTDGTILLQTNTTSPEGGSGRGWIAHNEKFKVSLTAGDYIEVVASAASSATFTLPENDLGYSIELTIVESSCQ